MRTIFGPVLFYEMVRAARRDRYFLLRGLYASGLFLLLLWVRTIWETDRHDRKIQPQDLAQLAEAFFYTYAAVQFAAVCLLTPGYVAGCIADDKERRTMEFLLATDLANREIVFGKMIARVSNLTMFLLAGLPVLSIIQFFGGIDPAILLLTFAATAVTMLGLVGISMVNSVQRRRVRDAILMTYVLAVAYLGVSWLLVGLMGLAGSSGNTAFAQFMTKAEPLIDVFRWGDPARALYEVGQVINRSAAHGPELLRILGTYSAFHGSVFLLGVAYSIWRLRAIALAQASVGTVKAARRLKRKRRPAVSGRRPMLWKEIHVEGTLKLGWFGRIGLNLLIVLAFTPLAIGLYLYFFEFDFRRSGDIGRELINPWVRGMNAVVGSLMLVGIAVRAAGAIGSERDADTMTSLLTTPLTANEILYGKFWGAIFSVRKLAYWLVAVWLIGIVSMSVNPIALLIEPIAFIPPAIAAAAIGLFISVTTKSTLRSIVLTLLAMVFMLGGHWMLGCMCCYFPIGVGGGAHSLEHILAFEIGGTPPYVFGMIPFHPDESWMYQNDFPARFVVAVFGLLAWLAIGLVLAAKTWDSFARATNRAGPLHPEQLPTAQAA